MAVWADIFVQSVTASPAATTAATVTLSNGSATVGNLLVLCVVPGGEADPDTAALEASGWHLDVASTAAWRVGFIFSRRIATSGISSVVVPFTTANTPAIRLIELSGVGSYNASSFVNDSASTGAVTTTVGDVVIIALAGAVINSGSGLPTFDTWSNSFNPLGSVQSAVGSGELPNRVTMGVAERVVSTTGTYSSVATLGGNGDTSILDPNGMAVAYQLGAGVPVVTVGASSSIGVGNAFTRVANENSNGGTISSRSWKVQTGPASVNQIISTTASLSWAPPTAGTYTLRYSATNEAGTTTADVEVRAVAPVVSTDSSSPIVATLDLGVWRSRIRAEGPGGVSSYSDWTDPITVFPGSLNLPRVPWEGGPAYYEQFSATAGTEWTTDAFFPVGYWGAYTDTESRVANNASLGINFYPEMYNNTQPGWQQWLRTHGIYSFVNGDGSEWVSRSYYDETDMWAGEGFDPWTGNIGFVPNVCEPDDPRGCGFTVINTMYSGWPTNDGRMHYANLGKGAMMWQGPAARRTWINGSDGPDPSALWRPLSVCTADLYFYTDTNISGEAPTWLGVPTGEVRRAANYGEVLMPRMRTASMADNNGSLNTVLGVVIELGGQGPGFNISADQVEGATWSTLIHEARCVAYFSHVFAGTAQNPDSSDVLSGGQSEYSETRARVGTISSQIRQLAPVLNTQSYVWNFNSNLSTMLKAHTNNFYIFAMQKRQYTNGTYTYTLPAGMPTTGTVEVMFENRTLPITNGTFSDSFAAEYSHHTYRISQ